MTSFDDALTLKAGVLILSIIGVFSLTSLMLYVSVEQLDNGGSDLLSKAQEIPHVAGWRNDAWIEQQQLLRARPASDSRILKKEFEKQYPPSDRDRIRDFVSGLKLHKYETQADMPYDIHNCPPNPPKDYPFAWNVMDVLNNWNPDDTTPPSQIYQGLCVFDWEKDRDTAERYRKAELPFIIQNQPDLLRTAERWNRNDDYLIKLLGDKQFRTEYSKSNHMMFWKTNRNSVHVPEGWNKPTENKKLNYREWLAKARAMEGTPNHADKEHWYFRINSSFQGDNNFVYDEVPIFNPTHPSFFMVTPREQRGINCRFGMKGVIAELHYDQSRNFIVVLGGERRYVLAHPRECLNLALYPQGHPSGRHSAVNWSNPNLKEHPEFANAMVNEVVLQAGDALYLPTFWFHFIVSLNINYQCNARSGTTWEYRPEIQACGFG